ncbi:MAG: response regulator transcription factor [Candidatus Marinimicrobia bacterium]|nr:response regulator transcription factor [Candidatus Neomarinimicrobiota bacterium]
MNILLVDDSDIIRQAISNILSKVEGIASIREVSNVKKALILINDYRPDVVIMDIHLRNGNGLNILKFIKEKFSNIMVIILTNDALPEYRKICDDFGADYFFDKSSEFEKIVDVINKTKNTNNTQHNRKGKET